MMKFRVLLTVIANVVLYNVFWLEETTNSFVQLWYFQEKNVLLAFAVDFWSSHECPITLLLSVNFSSSMWSINVLLQVHKLHSLARHSLAACQIISSQYQSDDLPGGVWRHGATLDVSL